MQHFLVCLSTRKETEISFLTRFFSSLTKTRKIAVISYVTLFFSSNHAVFLVEPRGFSRNWRPPISVEKKRNLGPVRNRHPLPKQKSRLFSRPKGTVSLRFTFPFSIRQAGDIERPKGRKGGFRGLRPPAGCRPGPRGPAAPRLRRLPLLGSGRLKGPKTPNA